MPFNTAPLFKSSSSLRDRGRRDSGNEVGSSQPTAAAAAAFGGPGGYALQLQFTAYADRCQVAFALSSLWAAWVPSGLLT